MRPIRKAGRGRRAPYAGLNRIRFQEFSLNPLFGIPLAAIGNYTTLGETHLELEAQRRGYSTILP